MASLESIFNTAGDSRVLLLNLLSAFLAVARSVTEPMRTRNGQEISETSD